MNLGSNGKHAYHYTTKVTCWSKEEVHVGKSPLTVTLRNLYIQSVAQTDKIFRYCWSLLSRPECFTFHHIGLQTANTEISWRKNCPVYSMMYQWWSENESGSHVTVHHHNLALSHKVFWTTSTVTDALVEEDPLHGLHAQLILILWISYGDT
jgi:hypothetical protein